eukprot:10625905-Karenia_brevis.AAC.1
MTLPSKTDSRINEGIVLIEVDDILEGGPSHRHREYFDRSCKRWKCGKCKKLRDEKEGTFTSGARAIQHKDFSCTWHME